MQYLVNCIETIVALILVLFILYIIPLRFWFLVFIVAFILDIIINTKHTNHWK